MEENIKNKLLELGFIDRFFYDSILSLRIDEMSKNELYELYKLRLKINIKYNDEDGIRFCKRYLENITKCKGKKLLSFLLKTEENSKSFFSDEDMTIIW